MRHFKIVLLFFALISCKKDDSSDFLKGPWIVSSLMNIELNTRPNKYSNSISPDSIAIKSILIDQNFFIDSINARLKISCNSKFKIYLFNKDEAKELIGTNTGGGANPKRDELYYTFLQPPCYYPDLKIYSYLGKHELVHLVTNKIFGKSGIRLMGEGYAVAIENSYGAHYSVNGELQRTLISEHMKGFVKNNSLLTPAELLDDVNTVEGIYYPQAGSFINWLFDTFGVEQVNKLYLVNKTDFRNKFKTLFNRDFNDLETEYFNYCKAEYK